MKNVLLSVSVGMMMLVSVRAELVERNWVSQSVYVNAYYTGWGMGLPLPEEDGYGAGWQVDIALAGSSPGLPSLDENAGTSSMYGWYDGYGYWVDAFTFDAFEGQAVVMRIFNAVEKADATLYLDSLPVVLPELSNPPHPASTDITFEFIPEPSSVAMIGLASGCALFIRRIFAG